MSTAGVHFDSISPRMRSLTVWLSHRMTVNSASGISMCDPASLSLVVVLLSLLGSAAFVDSYSAVCRSDARMFVETPVVVINVSIVSPDCK